MLDWSNWQVVYVTVSYNDEEHNYFVQENVRLDANNFFQSFEILAFEAQNTIPYKYNLRFAKAGSAPVSIEDQENTDGLLMIQEPTEPEQ